MGIFLNREVVMEDIVKRYPAYMLQTYNMTDCTLYQENKGSQEWLGYVMTVASKSYNVFARYDVNDSDELALDHEKGWTVILDGEELATALPSLQYVFDLLHLSKKEEVSS